MTTTRLKRTGLIATAAALVAAAVSITAAAGDRPLNYGNCASYEAMFGDVRAFTETSGPATVVGDMVNLPPGSDRLYTACGIPAA